MSDIAIKVEGLSKRHKIARLQCRDDARRDRLAIGVIYICTGRYRLFLKKFLASADRNFLPGHLKHYFVFTDTLEKALPHCRSTIIHQPRLGWPYDTLMRFEIISRSEGLLREMDFLFFANANMLVCSAVNDEILPGSNESHLVGVQHPGYFSETCANFPYERDSRSTAYVAMGGGKTYYQGCLFGGRSGEFLNLCSILQRRVQQDLDNGLIATWHDESHLNRFFISTEPLTLSPSYAYPENLSIPFERKIMQLDKSRFGGHDYLRSVPNTSPSPSVVSRTLGLGRSLANRLWSSSVHRIRE
jgi:hypothetical protein